MSVEAGDIRFDFDRVMMSHGGGGKAMRDLIGDVFVPVFGSEGVEDQARLFSEAAQFPGSKLAFTTDGFVVSPLEFPGGDIGRLAVCGTVNDLAVGGAKPLWLSAAFIIEEGFEIELLRRIAVSMQAAAEEAGVRIVTGDTKVVGKGFADGVFVTTSGIGVIEAGRELSAQRVCAGDVAIVNGVLGDHGAAILSARGEMALESDLESDCQPLNGLMEVVLGAAPGVRAARDATRGGLASALNEIASAAGVGIELEEEKIPVRPEVRGVCEILGLEPLYLANEGRLVLFVPEDQAQAALEAMCGQASGRGSVIIGRAVEGHCGQVVMRTLFGGGRIVDMLSGEQLPRIC